MYQALNLGIEIRKRQLLAILMVVLLTRAMPVVADNPSLTGEFDCVTAFDLVAGFAAPDCPSVERDETSRDKIAVAIDLLTKYSFVTDATFADVSVRFCPLTRGLGFVPKPNTILVDDGLRAGSADTLAEVVFHELQHVKQIHKMGLEKFKCAYIKEFLECGGCMDKNHALEAPAYAAQAQVRDVLLARWLQNVED